MVAITRRLSRRRYRGVSGEETAEPGMPGGFSGGAGSLASSLVASYGWDLIVGLLLTPWLAASRAPEPPP